MIVKLLAYTQNADAICAAAGNSCYSERPSYEIAEDINAERVLSRIVGMGHHSVTTTEIYLHLCDPDKRRRALAEAERARASELQ